MAAMTARRQLNRYQRGAVNGSAAYDFDYLERQRREEERERNRQERTYREAAPAVQARPRAQARPRQQMRVSPMIVLGVLALAGLLVLLLTQYVKLNAISTEVNQMQSQLAVLQDEHVTLLTRYEQTFDTATVKNAAERAGMSKPSSSQIYYMDLSEPDSITLYGNTETGVFSKVFTSLGQGVCSLVEYFR